MTTKDVFPTLSDVACGENHLHGEPVLENTPLSGWFLTNRGPRLHSGPQNTILQLPAMNRCVVWVGASPPPGGQADEWGRKGAKAAEGPSLAVKRRATSASTFTPGFWGLLKGRRLPKQLFHRNPATSPFTI